MTDAPPPDAVAPEAAAADPDTRWARRRAVISTAVALLAVAVVLVLAAVVRHEQSEPDTGPLVVAGGLDQPGAATPACQHVLAALPGALAGRARRTLIDPPPATVAWGDPAVILRCGTPTPTELTCSSELIVIDHSTSWLELDSADTTTYLLADRQVRIALTVPPHTDSGPIQQVAATVQQVLPAREVCDGAGHLLTMDGGG